MAELLGRPLRVPSRWLAWLAKGSLSTWITAPIAVAIGLGLTALVNHVTNLSGLRNGFFLLSAFLALSVTVLVGAKAGAVALQRHGPLAQAVQRAQERVRQRLDA